MEVFVKRALKDIRKKASSRKYRPLRAAVDSVLNAIGEREAAGGAADEVADKYFLPFKLACESRNATVMEIALDMLHKLIAYGYLRGAGASTAETQLVDERAAGGDGAREDGKSADDGSEGSDDRRLIDDVVAAICSCSNFADDHVQLQVLKALVTAVTCTTCEVHEKSLLLAVRACYHIHLVSKNAVNKTTAKGTLTQMLSIVFQRMEAHDQRLRLAAEAAAKEAADAAAAAAAEAVAAAAAAAAAGDVEAEAAHRAKAEEAAAAAAAAVARAAAVDSMDAAAATQGQLGDALSPAAAAAASVAAEGGDSGAVLAQLLASGERHAISGRPTQPWLAGQPFSIDVHSAITHEPEGMYAAVFAQLAFDPPGTHHAGAHVAWAGGSAAASGAGGDGSSGGSGSGEHDAAGGAAAASGRRGSRSGGRRRRQLQFRTILHKDAYLLFRALCSLSQQGQPEDESVPPDPITLQSKILSLELLLSVLKESGPSFRRSKSFLHIVKGKLCSSLLKNCVSGVTKIAALSLHIFMTLVTHFKDYLKGEIEVFITQLFLRILQSAYSTYEHKVRLLELFRRICRDASMVVEIFLNYDCDADSMDLFERIVHALAKQAQSQTREEEEAVRTLAVESLVAIMESLVEYGSDEDDGLHGAGGDAAGSDSAGSVRSLDPAGGAGGAGGGGGAADDSSSIASGAPAAADMLESFSRTRQLKRDLASGAIKFAIKPKNGIAFFIQRGMTGDSAAEVAAFLKAHNDDLNKTKLGEYLGGSKTYNKEILYAYVDLHDFSGMNFLTALRYFLAGFRLPGEGQVVDRIMETFAAAYFAANPKVFTCADAAYLLSFSTIMLQTDLHNPQIRDDRRMKLSQFISMNQSVEHGRDIPDAMLSDIYAEIKEHPITLVEDDEAREAAKAKAGSGGGGGGSSGGSGGGGVFGGGGRRKQELFTNEKRNILSATEAAIKQRRGGAGGGSVVRASAFITVHDIGLEQREQVRLMFDVAWAPMLAVFSVALETSDDPHLVGLCIRGLDRCIRVSAMVGMDTENSAFVGSLSKFTQLDDGGGRQPLTGKSIASIKALMKLALDDGDSLWNAWRPVLTAISEMARLQEVAAADPDAAVAAGPIMPHALPVHRPSPAPAAGAAASSASSSAASGASASSGSSAAGSGGSGSSSSGSGGDARLGPPPPPPPRRQVGGDGRSRARADSTSLMPPPVMRLEPADYLEPGEAAAIRAVEERNWRLLAHQLEGTLLDRVYTRSVRFGPDTIVAFVRQLCAVSLTELAVGRVFTLQKIVEVADYNMQARSRFVWAQVWETLSSHFTTVGCHANLGLAMVAIDSLRQLGVKFLRKTELSSFNFQKVFLRPFLVIIANSPSPDIRSLILECLSYMIQARTDNIRSGWNTMFRVFSVAARDPQADLVAQAFDTVVMIYDRYFQLLLPNFGKLVQCLAAFAISPQTDIALRAMALLQDCITRLARGGVLEPLQALMAAEAALRPPSRSFSSGASESKSSSGEGAATDGSAASAAAAAGGSAAGSSGGDGAADGSSSGDGEAGKLEEGVETAFTDDDLHTRLWWPLLMGVAGAVSDERLQVRRAALDVLFGSLSTHAHQLSPGLWELIFKGVLLPLFDDVRQPDAEQTALSVLMDGGAPWASTTCASALTALVALFCTRFAMLRFLLPDVLALLCSCVSQPHEGLARIGISRMRELLTGCVAAADDGSVVDQLLSSLASLVADSTPRALMHARAIMAGEAAVAGQLVATAMGVARVLSVSNDGRDYVVQLPWARLYLPAVQRLAPLAEADGGSAAGRAIRTLPFDERTVVTQLVVQLELVQLLGSVAMQYASHFTAAHWQALLQMLTTSMQFAHAFNVQTELQRQLFAAGFMRDRSKKPVSMLLHELSAVKQQLRILAHLLRSSEAPLRLQAAEQLRALFQQVFTHFIDNEASLGDELPTYNTLIVHCLGATAVYTPEEMQDHLSWLYPLLVRLVACDSREVRSSLRSVLLRLRGLRLPEAEADEE